MQTLCSTPFTRQKGHKSLPLAGGLQLLLDIEHAFDMISREKLFQRLHELGINPQTVQLLSVTHIYCNGEDTPLLVGKGVRQGCRAAPFLWNGYLWWFLVELSRVASLGSYGASMYTLMTARWEMCFMTIKNLTSYLKTSTQPCTFFNNLD